MDQDYLITKIINVCVSSMGYQMSNYKEVSDHVPEKIPLWDSVKVNLKLGEDEGFVAWGGEEETSKKCKAFIFH